MNNTMKSILVTGGAGFIGSNYLFYWTRKYPNDRIIVLDLLTYAGNYSTIKPLIDKKTITFIHGDICDLELVTDVFKKYDIDTVVNFAAESHVDRSILSPADFIRTNVLGTQVLLSVALDSWKESFDGKRFHHVSTDEVYGELELDEPAFTEETPYSPRSIYAASKASSDMLVRAFSSTHGLPISISNCSNNYGPYQYPEKLIPLVLLNILQNKPLPVYGNGSNVRDWLFVEDHCRAIDAILNSDCVGETYNVGGGSEFTNIDLVEKICRIVDLKINQDDDLLQRFSASPSAKGKTSDMLIQFVKDRPGHDRRYAINPAKIISDLDFHVETNIETGLASTVDWYLNNEVWWRKVLSGEINEWVKKQYGQD